MKLKCVSLCWLLLLCLGGVSGRAPGSLWERILAWFNSPADPELINSRIINGYTVNPGDYPSMVGLYYTDIFGSYFICGGTLLNVNHVLTSAECLRGYTARSIDVVAGDLRLSDTTGSEQLIPGEEKFVHDYSSATKLNDIAILKMSSSFTLQPGVVEVVPLPYDYQVPSGNCTVVGWGDTTIGGDFSDDLRAFDMPPISDAECAEAYDPDPTFIDQLCAGIFATGGLCNGDGGGPLFCDGVQMGIVSMGISCVTYPAIFTEVSHYLDWIRIHAEM